MKLRFLQYRTGLLLNKKQSFRASLPYKQSLTIGVIFTVEDKQKHFAVKDFIKRMEGDGKNVQVLEYLPLKTENYEFKFDFFEDKDISFWGNITSQAAIQFAEAPFDFLFYLDLSPNPAILHLLAKSRAKCRVGKCWENGDQYLDFMVESVSSYPLLIENIYRYISQLK